MNIQNAQKPRRLRLKLFSRRWLMTLNGIYDPGGSSAFLKITTIKINSWINQVIHQVPDKLQN